MHKVSLDFISRRIIRQTEQDFDGDMSRDREMFMVTQKTRIAIMNGKQSTLTQERKYEPRREEKPKWKK
jgi:hypothetical protein